MAKKIEVFGAIKNTRTGEEFDWDGASKEQVLADLSKLIGTAHGYDWRMAGDLDITDSDACIVVTGRTEPFHGASAVRKLKTYLKGVK